MVSSCKKKEKILHKPYDVGIKSVQQDILDNSINNDTKLVDDDSTNVVVEDRKMAELEGNAALSPPSVKTDKGKVQKENVFAKRSQIKFENPIYKGGEITEGDVVKHQFKFSNTGKFPLEILKAEGTCGCTVPSFPFLAIEPGGEGYIGVIYHSVGKVGEQSPEIVVTTDGIPATVTLKMYLFIHDKDEQKGSESQTKDSTSIGF